MMNSWTVDYQRLFEPTTLKLIKATTSSINYSSYVFATQLTPNKVVFQQITACNTKIPRACIGCMYPISNECYTILDYYNAYNMMTHQCGVRSIIGCVASAPRGLSCTRGALKGRGLPAVSEHRFVRGHVVFTWPVFPAKQTSCRSCREKSPSNDNHF